MGTKKVADRNHLYLYTVDLVNPRPDNVEGQRVQVEAYNIQQVAYKLGRELNGVHYVHKVILHGK